MTNRISPNPALNPTSRVREKSFKWFGKGYIKHISLVQDCERSRSDLEQCRPSQPSSPLHLESIAAVDVSSTQGQQASAASLLQCPSCLDANGLEQGLEIDVRWI